MLPFVNHPLLPQKHCVWCVHVESLRTTDTIVKSSFAYKVTTSLPINIRHSLHSSATQKLETKCIYYLLIMLLGKHKHEFIAYRPSSPNDRKALSSLCLRSFNEIFSLSTVQSVAICLYVCLYYIKIYWEQREFAFSTCLCLFFVIWSWRAPTHE